MQTINNKTDKAFTVERVFNPHREAMLAALRVALDLPRVPVTLIEEKESSN